MTTIAGTGCRYASPLLGLFMVAALLSGCAGPSAPPSAPPSPPPSSSNVPAPVPGVPASPADSPPPAVAPAGTVVPVGPGAEGVAVDARTRTIAVGTRTPNELVLLDMTTRAVRARVALPGHLRHLSLGPDGTGQLLVPDEDSGRLLVVDLASGRIQSTTPIGASPHYALPAPDGTTFVADEAGHRVAVLRAGQPQASLTDAVMPGGMALAAGRLGVVDVAFDTLTLYDATTLARLASVPLGSGPTHEVADARGDLVAADTRGQALLFVTPAVPPALRLRLPLDGSPYGLAYDTAHDRLWVTLTARNEVVGFDTSGDAPREVARYPTVRQPNTVAVDPTTGMLLVTGAADGVLQVIDGPR